MGRKKISTQSVSKMSDNEVYAHFKQSIIVIEKLCEIYDSGVNYIAFNIAAEIHRLLTTDGLSIQLRKMLKFSTPALDANQENLLTNNKLVRIRISWPPPQAVFEPKLEDDPSNTRLITFREWWNRDIIYKRGAYAEMPGSKTRVFTVKEDVEFRPTLTRREFIEKIRNNLGAHLDLHQSDLIDELRSPDGYNYPMPFSIDGVEVTPGLSDVDVQVGPAGAMCRQIAFEVLKAYAGSQHNKNV